jgi:hypothetical protein
LGAVYDSQRGCGLIIPNRVPKVGIDREKKHTNNERDHGGTISAGGFKTLDELLDLPDLNVLLGFTALSLLLGTHGGRGEGDRGEESVSEALPVDA